MNAWRMWNGTRNFTRLKRFDFTLFNTTTIPIFIVLAFFSWMVNITMLITIFLDRLHCLKKMSGWFVASISAVSIILATSIILLAMQFVPETKVNNPTYQYVLSFLLAAPITCTLSFLMVISLERLFLISKPLRYRIFMTESKVRRITVSLWVISIGVGVLQRWLFRNHREIYQRIMYLGIAPIIFLILVNAMVFYKLKTMKKALTSITDSTIQQSSQARLKTEKRFSLVVLLLLVNFVLFACPFYVGDILIQTNSLCGGCIVAGTLPVGKIYFTTLLLLQFHATNNVLFYLILIPKYRQSFIVTWKALVC